MKNTYILLLNNINIWFFTPHNIWPRKIELECIWIILLDKINCTKKWGDIVDVLLVFVTMTCNIESWIIKHSNVNGDVIMHKLPKDGAVRTAWINAMLRVRTQ